MRFMIQEVEGLWQVSRFHDPNFKNQIIYATFTYYGDAVRFLKTLIKSYQKEKSS